MPSPEPSADPDPTPSVPARPQVDRDYIVRAYGVVAVAIVVAVLLTILIHAPALVTATGFTSFSVIYIVAQAIERLLQPISEMAGKPEEVETARQSFVAADGKAAEESAKKELDYRKLERATFFWAAATCIALVVCGALGLGLLQTVVEFSNKTVPGWFEALDVVVTGLAIGAGTKPLHDLIGAIQKAKEGGTAAA